MFLGPDIGYNVDYGGFYIGPSWNVHVLDGWAWVSPIFSYGGGTRLAPHDGIPQTVAAEPGLGLLAHFRSPENITNFGYSTQLREPILLSQEYLFGRDTTRLRFSINEYYANGFFGVERPRVDGEFVDLEQHPFLRGHWVLRTFFLGRDGQG